MQQRLDVGAVIRQVWSIYVDQASVLMPAAAAVFVVTGIVAALLASGGTVLGVLVAEIIVIVAGMLFTGMVVELVADVQDGRRDSSPGQLLRAAAPVLGQLILVGLAASVAIVVGFFLLIVPGLILLTMWSVFVPVIVLERPAGLGSLGRSRELVRGNGWQVFGVLFVLFVLVGVVSGIIDGAAASAGTGAGIAVRVIVGVLTAPLTALAAAVLYFQLKAAAAGAGDVTAPPPGPVDTAPPGPAAPPTPPAPSAEAGEAFAQRPEH
ncbi:MAG TPA: hypothetical protein VF380_04130 [Solirubrobacteraceae bacterium]